MRAARLLVVLLLALVVLAAGLVAVLVARTPSPIAARALATAPAPRLDDLPRAENWPESCVVSSRDELAGPEDLERDARVGPMITTVEPAGEHLYVSSLMGFGVARCAR